MKINWLVRFKNINFWLTFVPAVLLLVQAVAAAFGIQLDLSELQQRILDIVNAVFGVLTVLGVATDHTTPGLSDSERAQNYIAPGKLPK